MEANSERPRVGSGVMVFRDGKILLGKRRGSHGEGEYSFPGGHLEYMESFADCVRRELAEECGITVKNIQFLRAGNTKRYAPRHYVDVDFTAEWESGEPRVLEPEKCESWGWYDLEHLPAPLFGVTASMIEAYRKSELFHDA